MRPNHGIMGLPGYQGGALIKRLARYAAMRPALARRIQGFSQKFLRRNYPTPAPGIPRVGARGNEFLQRGTDEANEAFMARRAAIQKDIDAGNYKPYFDESQRYYADKSLLTGPTRVPDPALPATKQKWLAKYSTPATRARLNAAYDAAIGSPDAIDWYAMGQLQDDAIAFLGKEKGSEWFARKFADQMGATTSGAKPTENFLKSMYGNYLRRRDLELPLDVLGGVSKVPRPISGEYIKGPLQQGFKVADAGGIERVTSPKEWSFSQNFQGNLDQPTIDAQMMKIFDPSGKNKLTPPRYSSASDVIIDEAAKRGRKPAQFQDVAWAGIKGSEGMPMIRHVNESIERTARLTGQTPLQVVRRWQAEDAPMFGIISLLGMGPNHGIMDLSATETIPNALRDDQRKWHPPMRLP